jgi:hypothetical protein
VESMKHCFMESLWNPLYFGQSLWTPCGVFMDSTWTPHGVHGDYWELVGNAVWSPHGLYMETPQSLHGWKPVGECKVLEGPMDDVDKSIG